MSHEYETLRRVLIECPPDSEHHGATFVPVCRHCGRFVKARETIGFKGYMPSGPNADCKRCGPVQMLFEGFL